MQPHRSITCWRPSCCIVSVGFKPAAWIQWGWLDVNASSGIDVIQCDAQDGAQGGAQGDAQGVAQGDSQGDAQGDAQWD